MGLEIRLSVALVTRNRPESLRRCLSSLRQQSVQPFEVVISDDSDRQYSGVTRDIALDQGCRYLAGPRRGLYANRNFVAQHCLGTHIRTMDDDHLLPPNHLAQCYSAIEQDRSAIWTTGESGYVGGKLVATAARANQLHPSGVGGPIENPDDNWGISDGSTVYPSEIFARGFRMVENFGFGSSYLEFGAFLYVNGWKCRTFSDRRGDVGRTLPALDRGTSKSLDGRRLAGESALGPLAVMIHHRTKGILRLRLAIECVATTALFWIWFISYTAIVPSGEGVAAAPYFAYLAALLAGLLLETLTADFTKAVRQIQDPGLTAQLQASVRQTCFSVGVLFLLLVLTKDRFMRGFRGEAETPGAISARLQSDLAYLENRSLLLELSIIARTAWQLVFPPRNAR